MNLDDIQKATSDDLTLLKAMSLVRTGRWFELDQLSDPVVNIQELGQYRNCKDELTCHADNILLRNDKTVIPTSLCDLSCTWRSPWYGTNQGFDMLKSQVSRNQRESWTDSTQVHCMPSCEWQTRTLWTTTHITSATWLAESEHGLL